MTLYLFPNALSKESSPDLWLSPALYEAAAELDSVIAESPKASRLFFKSLSLQRQELPLAIYNKKTPDKDLDFLLEPLKKGQKLGLLSDAGMPCVADPGSRLVKLARKSCFPVIAFTGPCSITLSLVLSGLPSQSFAFHGYLPSKESERKELLSELEKASLRSKRTEIFIEAPHRSQESLKEFLRLLRPATLLSVSCDLHSPSEFTMTHSIQQWQKLDLPDLHKRPAVFLFSA